MALGDYQCRKTGAGNILIIWKRGRVARVLENRPGLQELEVEVEGKSARAWNYPLLTGAASPGDEVYLNTTAVELGLGSGGYHFVIANLTRIPLPQKQGGHIIKLRYTPYQFRVLSAEEEESPHRRKLEGFQSLGGTPVIIGELHSMLAPAVAGCLAGSEGKAKVVYVMTDGAALPLQLSKSVRELKEKGMLSGTVTAGHAFGGDLEAVNIYSALAVAFAVLHADVIIVTMGPGIVGTGTKWGTTALEQGEIVNAVNILGGRAIAIPRISFADPRPRHQGVSHHTLTALGEVALLPAWVPLPELPPEQLALVQQQLEEGGVLKKHRIVVRKGDAALCYLEEKNIKVQSMGRKPGDDPAFFLCAGAAGILAAEFLKEKGEPDA